MSPSPVNVGHIDDVQELRKAKPTSIPERFVRETTASVAVAPPPLSSNIPIIDFSNLRNPNNPQLFDSEILKLRSACEDWGFFQVVNHGIELESMERVGGEFFMLPIEEKQKYSMAAGTVQGYGQAFVFSEEQKLDWCNMLALGVSPRRPEVWPSSPAGLTQTVESYSREVGALCREVLEHMGTGLGLGVRLRDMFGAPVQALRMNYYPPCPRPDLVLGLSPHSDGSGLTVLHQAQAPSASLGLQILKQALWLPLLPLPNALVINVGDTIEVLTNGRFKSVEHRAVTHKDKHRLSIVTFYAPSYDFQVGPIPDLLHEHNPSNYRTYNHGDYSNHYVTNKLQGKKSLDFAKFTT